MILKSDEYLKRALHTYMQWEADKWFENIANQTDEEFSPEVIKRFKSSFISGYLMGLNFYTEILPSNIDILIEMMKRNDKIIKK